MRITVLTSSYPRFPGDGTAPFVKSICEELALLGHAVEVVAPYDPAVQADASARVVVHRFHYTPVKAWHIMGHAKSLADDARVRPGAFLLLPFFMIAALAAVLRVARQQRAEVIHAHWVIPNGLVAALAAGWLHLPLVITLHGSDMFVARHNRVAGWLAGWAFRRASLITACSDDLRAGAITLGARPERVLLLAWGADADRFQPDTPPLPRAHFELSDEDLVVVALGRLVPKKGFDVLLRALPSLIGSAPGARLVIGGAGAQRERLRELASDLGVSGHVRWAGPISWNDVPPFLALADVFALPSVRDEAGNLDGLPTVLLEAMALGKAVVASRIAGVPLVIEDDANGLLVSPGDPQELGEALARLLSDGALRLNLGRAARRSVEEHFTWRQVVSGLSARFEALRSES